jgi:uridine kinase
MSDKHEIYHRTLSFLLGAALREALPERKVYAGYLLGGSYCYTFTHKAKLLEQEIDSLKAEMRRLIEQDIEIQSYNLNYAEALAYFEKDGQGDAALLLRQRGRALVRVNRLKDFITLYSEPLLPRTGLVSLFDILPCYGGFCLTFPREYGGGFREKIPENPKAFSVYHEYMKWGRITGVHSAGCINKIIAEGTIKEFIRINEAFQAKKLSTAADEIYKRQDEIKVVLIAGPSSSGKTTTSKKLSMHLKVLGIKAIEISLDDYYLHPDKAPKDENGQPDLECLEALDVDYLNKQLLDILDGKETTLPIYDFKTKTRRQGGTIRLNARREVLVIEGIHGLNDALTPQIKAKNKFKLYVSVFSQLGLDGHNRVSACSNRLLRRIVRDRQFRGASAQRTLAMWESVQRGAEKYILRFEDSADAVFNSAFDYEIPVLKCYAEPLLREIKPGDSEYGEAERLLDFLDNFTALPPQFVPGESILREFIGGSDFKY